MTVRREASNRADVKVITEEVSLDQSGSCNENRTLRRDLINEANIVENTHIRMHYWWHTLEVLFGP